MQLVIRSTMRDQRAGAEPSRDVNVYALLAARARAASRRSLAWTAAGAGGVAVAAVLLGAGHWTVLTACYLVWSYAVWGLVFGPTHPSTRTWRSIELLIVGSGTALAVVLFVGVFYLALGPRWML
jgi:hypothetical protein